MPATQPSAIGLDFGTTNSVAATARGDAADLVMLDAPDGADAVFRSALCFWEDDPTQLRHPATALGANRFPLTEAQRNVRRFGACDRRSLRFTRRPLPDEPLDPRWHPIG